MMNSPKPEGRRWPRRLLRLFLLLVLLVFLSPLLLRVPFVRDRIAAEATRVVGQPVHIKNASAWWWSGITLEGIRVDSPEGFEEPLATVRRIHIGLGLLDLVRGRIDARLEVFSPWITFQEDATGRSNTDALFPDTKDKDERAKEKREKKGDWDDGIHIAFVLEDGLLRARTPRTKTPQEIRDLNVSFEVDGLRGVEARLKALAVGAGLEGADALLEVEAHIPAKTGEEGPIRIRVPDLDLARLGALAEGMAHIKGLRGVLSIDVDARVTAPSDVAGKIDARLERLGLALPDGTRVDVRSLRLGGDLEAAGDDAGGRLTLVGEDLRIGPGALSYRGYREPKIEATLLATREVSGDVALTLDGFHSRLFQISRRQDGAPLRVLQHGEEVWAEGSAFLRLDLPVLVEAFGKAMGLESGDTMKGTLDLDIGLKRAPEAQTVALDLRGSRLALPASWGGADLPPANVKGHVDVEVHDDGRTIVKIPSLQGFGFDVLLDALLGQAGLERAHVEVSGDLARARPLLKGLLDLAPREQIAGLLHAQADARPENDGTVITAEVKLERFRLTDETGRVTLDEPLIHVTKKVFAQTTADEKGSTRYRIDAFRLEVAGLIVDLEGSAVGTRRNGSPLPEYVLDAKATLSGDAARLAPTLVRTLGKDYADLAGRGPIRGSLALRGSMARNGETLLVHGEVQPGSWTSGGLSLDAPKLTVRRDAVKDPLRLEIRSGVNTGTLAVDVSLRPRADAIGWQADLKMGKVDTSPLLLDRGAGQYLTLLFPTLIPSDTDARVLSGLLDAEVHLAAADLGGPTMAPTLTGKGSVSMADGAIGQSTLFKVAGSSGGLGQAGQMLAKAVPEADRVLDELSRALTFTKIESRFRIGKEVVMIDHGLLDGESVKVGFKGPVAFDQRVNLKVPLMIKGDVAKQLNSLIGSPALPLTIQGTLDDPRIKPDIDMRKLATGALKGLIPGAGGDPKNPLEKLKGLLPR